MFLPSLPKNALSLLVSVLQFRGLPIQRTDSLWSSGLTVQSVPGIFLGVVTDSVLCRKAVDEKWAMWNFDTGIQTLVDAITTDLTNQGVDIRTNCPCTGLQKTGSGFLVSLK